MHIYIRIYLREKNVIIELKRHLKALKWLETKKIKIFYLWIMSLFYNVSILTNVWNLFQPFFLSPVIKLNIWPFKVWVESTYFFSMGYKLEPYESWFVGMSDFLHLSDFSFVQFQRLCISILLALWVSEIITHLMNLFLDYEKDELIIVTSTGTKKQKWNCQKGWKITPSLLTYNKWLIF